MTYLSNITTKQIVKLECARRDITITKLAELIGVSQSGLSNALKQKNMNPIWCYRIAKALEDQDLEYKLLNSSNG